MSLDTLLEIGKVLRKSPDGLKHHCDIRIPKTDKKSDITYWSIPVGDNGRIKSDQISKVELENEYIIPKLLYLDYKMSRDRNFRYIFGDIYNLKDLRKSFLYDKEAIKFINETTSLINPFRESLENKLDQFQEILNDAPFTYLHFDFEGKHWYELEKELKLILVDLKMRYFAEKFEYGFYLKSSPHRTLKSHQDYRAKTFESLDEVSDLMYAIDYSNKPKVLERDIKIVILPNIQGKSIDAKDLQEFFEKSYNSIDNSALITEEEKLSPSKRSSARPKKKSQEQDKLIELTENLERNTKFNLFDFLFVSKGENVDYDLIEISGIQKSFLKKITDRIICIKENLHSQFIQEFPNVENPPNLQVFWAFNNIVNQQKKKIDSNDRLELLPKKYRNHLLKVLPKIYTASYYRDDLLLPCFIQQVETKIRDGTENYNFLKYEYYFLTDLRNPLPPKDSFQSNTYIKDMKQNSISYQIGLKLGELAKPFKKDKNGNSLINSFEVKNLGYLTRRITDLNSLRAFQVEILQKIQLHQKHINEKWFYHQLNGKTNSELVEYIKQLQNQAEEKYNKHECAFGFFESYLKYTSKDTSNIITTEEITEGE